MSRYLGLAEKITVLAEKIIEMALRDQNLVIDPEHAKEMCDRVMKAIEELEAEV